LILGGVSYILIKTPQEVEDMKKVALLIVVAALAVCLAGVSYAEITKREAVITEMDGTANVKTPEGTWLPAEVGMKLTEGSVLKTGAASMVLLYLEGVSETADVEIKENTELRIEELYEDRDSSEQTTLLDLALGEILITSQKLRSEKSQFEVKTPTSIVGVRGTTFSVIVEKEE
jgi:hypothetical protein